MIWYLDLAIVGRTIVGKVHQLATEGDSARHGAVRQVGKWEAIGMLAAWNDTPLGSDHYTRAAAMQAVADWHAANEGKRNDVD